MSIIYIRGFEDQNVISSDVEVNGETGVSDIPGGGYCVRVDTNNIGHFYLVPAADMSADDAPDFTTCYIRMYGKTAASISRSNLYWVIRDTSENDIAAITADGHVWIVGVDKGDQGFLLGWTAWTRIEFGVKVNSVSGHVIVRVDGVEVYSIYTDLSAHPAVGSLGVRNTIESSSPYMDDVVINDTQGAKNNSWPGAGHIYGLVPDGVGTNSDLTSHLGGDNYADVDETPNDGDTSYVESNADGDIDTYTFENLGANLIVKGVAVHTISKLASAGTTEIEAVALYNGNYDKKTVPALTTSYTRRGAVFEDAPDGAAWTKAKVDAAEFGVEVQV